MRPRILAALAGLVLVAGACGDSAEPVEQQAPVTTTAAVEAEPADDMAEETDTVDNTAVDGVSEVPLLVEKEIEEALAEIERAGLVAEITPVWVPPSDPRLGIVITQSPDPFGWLPEGSVIQISVGE